MFRNRLNWKCQMKPIMKIYLFMLLALLCCLITTGCVSRPSANDKQPLLVNVMSYNIRYGSAEDGENHWRYRKQGMFEYLSSEAPDVLGVQEALDFQLKEIMENVSGYQFVGEGRDGGTSGEYNAIFYRSDKYILQDSGTFWLSETPQKPSIAWGNNCIRICTWAVLADKTTGRAFYVYNTHLDHVSQPSREKSVRLITKFMSKQNQSIPYVLTGDFNAGEDNAVIAYLKEQTVISLVDTFRAAHPHETIVGTANGFKVGNVNSAKIDYIFTNASANVLKADIHHPQYQGKYLSDHFPVTATLQFNQ